MYLGYTALHQQDYQRAATEFRSSLIWANQKGNRLGAAECLSALAAVAFERGHFERGVQLNGAAITTFEAIMNELLPPERLALEARVQMARERLGEASFEAAQTAGGALTLAQAIELAGSSIED